jgi:hypothetical protein
LYGYQNKGLAEWAVRICLKTREIRRGKKGKADGRMQTAKVRRGKKEAATERPNEVGVEQSQPMPTYYSYSVRYFYSTSIEKRAPIRTGSPKRKKTNG